MANPTAKFVSVNLNKSYGRPQSQPSSSSSTSSSRFGNGSRGKAGSGGGGSGMVVLSRPRSSGQKGGAKLSVPAPLNLPSLRKEHDRQDPSAGPGSLAGAGGGGLGAGHGPSGAGWCKPMVQEKDGGGVQSVRPGSGSGDPRAGGLGYMTSMSSGHPFLEEEKAAVLLGEDFPSLAAASYVSPQKVMPGQRQKQRLAGEELSGRQMSMAADVKGSPPRMRPQIRSARAASEERGANGANNSGLVSAGSQRNEDEFLTGPLPVVRLMHTSDWADDERDTSNGILDRSREKRFSRNEHGKCYGYSNGRSGNGPDISSSPSRELYSVDSYRRDLSVSGRDGASWRASQFSRDRIVARGTGIDRGLPGNYKSPALDRDIIREAGKYGKLSHMDLSWDGSGNGSRDSQQLWRDADYGQTTRMGRNGPESCNLGNSQHNENAHVRHGEGFNNRYRANDLQKDFAFMAPHSFGSNGLPLNDPIFNFSREKHLSSISGKSYVQGAKFDATDPFSDDFNLKVIRRKKDTLKQVSFDDPVRASFEAELERVQRMQEEERQRVLEEQARAMEIARKEEEERERMIREENERRKRQEDEAREAIRRVEQERLEASKKAQEAKIAREEEKKRIIAEEERRKEAARQKLLELEARIARRQAEAASKDVDPGDDRDVTNTHDVQESEVKEGEITIETEDGDWEDGERMVERITSSASSESSGLNRSFQTGSRPSSSKDVNSFFMGRPRHLNSWKKDAYDYNNGSAFQENGYLGQQQDAFEMERILPKKGFFGSTEAASSRTSSKEGMSEFHHARGNGWGSDHYHRSSDFCSAFLENDNYSGGAGWGQGQTHVRSCSPYPDGLLQNSDTDSFNSFGRSRNFMRQPRVLPPPSISSVQKRSFRAASERPSSLAHMGNETMDHISNRKDVKGMQSAYCNDQDRPGQLGTVSAPLTNMVEEEHEKNPSQCDSQSSVSVSSSPTSPAHFSHDDVDDSRHFHALLESNNGKKISSSVNAHAMPVPEVGITEIITYSSPVSLKDEDEWTIDNNDEMQELEEYDENVNTQEDDVCQDDCEGTARCCEDSQSNIQDRSIENNQMVLGFDEGIEVKIPDNDEFERTCSGEGKNDKQMVTGTVLDLGSFDGFIKDCGTCSYYENSTFKDANTKSPDSIEDPEKALQNLVIEHITSTSASTSSEAFVSSELHPKHPVESGLLSQSSLPTHSELSSASAVSSQTNTPMDLQFGLFSGPSLIPSPVPAIQIGSIQMPLHLHPPVGLPIPHMQSSQPPFLQFGQLHYTSPISQGILPLTQNMPFVQSSVPPLNTLNQNFGRILDNNVLSNSSIQNTQTKEKVVGSNRKACDVPQGSVEAKKPNVPDDIQQDDIVESQNQPMRCYDDKQNVENGESQSATSTVSSQLLSGGLTFVHSKTSNPISTQRGKTYVYTVKNAGSRSQSTGSAEDLHVDHNGLHRKTRRNVRRAEYRVRESGGRRNAGFDMSNYTMQCVKLDFNKVPGGSLRNVSKRATYVNRSTKSVLESQSTLPVSSSLQPVIPEFKSTGKEAASNQLMSPISNLQSRDGRLKNDGISEEVVDAPLQSGIVQIFKQPGIEIRSDEDDFIEVRSRRQMHSVRREQKEKEFKAKSRIFKSSRKHHSISRCNVISPILYKSSHSVGDHLASTSDSLGGGGTGISNCATSTAYSTNMSPPLLSVGTTVNPDGDACAMNKKTAQASTDTSISSDGSNLITDFDRGAPDCTISTSLDSWNNSHVNQQVMSLTQTQLDDAMKPEEFDSHTTSMSNTTSITGDQGNLPTSTVVMDKTFSTSTTFRSLLSGEKIQFGAITTPAILPPISRAAPIAMGCPGSSCRSDTSVEHNLTASDHESNIFEKEKCLDEIGTHIEDQDAEAEAAASAVAVAAISNDEVVSTSLAACSVSLPESDNFGRGVDASPSGGLNSMEVSSQSAKEESLGVTLTLPADLSVETPSLSLWPAFPSSQSSSGPLLSHFSAAPSSHFPFLDMNSMLGGPFFAFGGSPDESAVNQSQPQRSTLLGSGSLGAWPQCHSAAESFYGPPTGFPGPFINPHGGIPGMQAPPQMLFYNPFAPQYSLSIMGTAIVPPGKQADWKHNPVSSVTGASESSTSNFNAVPCQCNSPNTRSPMQHLGQVAPLVPMASHLPVFDMSSFQSSSDIPLQARWHHFSGASQNSVPISVLSDQRVDGGMPIQAVGQCLPAESSNGNSRFPESCPSVDGNRNFDTLTGSATQFPHELVLKETNSATACILPKEMSYESSSGNTNEISNCGSTAVNSCVSVNVMPTSNTSIINDTVSVIKSEVAPASASPQHLPPIGHPDHRGRLASQKVGSGNEWHRRSGLQGKSQVLGSEKNFPSKVKQVYVAKQPAKGTAVK